MQNKLIIGVTGGSGTGKGEVCKILAANGVYCIDADKIAHKVILKGNAAYDEVINAFGAGIIGYDGEISRKILGEIVFENKGKLDILSSIVHKWVDKECFGIITSTKEKIFAIDAAAIIEADMHKKMDYLIGVFALFETRIERITARDGIAKEAAIKRINSQMTEAELKMYIDYEIDNNLTLEILKQKVNNIFLEIMRIR